MGIDDLLQSCGVHLAKTPTLDSTAEGFEFGFTKVNGKNLLGESFLVEDAERLAGGEPRDDSREGFVGENGVEFFGKAWFAAVR